VYTRASPTDILARKSARRTKVRRQVWRAERAACAAAVGLQRRARQADYRGTPRRLPGEDPREEVGEKVRVGVGPVEFSFYGGWSGGGDKSRIGKKQVSCMVPEIYSHVNRPTTDRQTDAHHNIPLPEWTCSDY